MDSSSSTSSTTPSEVKKPSLADSLPEGFVLNRDWDPTNVNLFIATPCYAGQTTVEFTRSLIDFAVLATKIGLRFSVNTISNESLITRARNSLLAQFVASDATHLLFIDADIGFNPLFIVRLLTRGDGINGLAYPKKHYNTATIIQAVKEEPDISPELLMLRGLEHAVNFRVNAEGNSVISVDPTGFIEMEAISNGFMLISRECIDKLTKAFPETYRNDVKGYSSDLVYYNLFDTEIDHVSRRFLSEDYAFCKKWRSIGGKIFMDVHSRLVHCGYQAYPGNFFESLPKSVRDALTVKPESKGKEKE